MLDAGMRDWWVEKARPVVEAVQSAGGKTCAHCGELKPLSEFGMKGHLVRSYCIPCDKAYKLDHKARVLLKPARRRKWQDSVNDAQEKNQTDTRAKATEHYGTWTETDDAFLRANWHMPRKEVALHLGRTYAAVATRKLKLRKLQDG